MVTKSKLFNIFDEIKDKKRAFCVLCLRNQDETKLTKPKAFTLFMETFNHKFENPMICYMCEAKAESALTFVSMVHFAVTVEKIIKEIFSYNRKYHNTKLKMLELLSYPSTLLTPFMKDVWDCEEMVAIIRERTSFRRTDTLTIFACDEHSDTGQQPAVSKSYNPPVQRTPILDNIVLIPATINGSGPKKVDQSNAMLYKKILIPAKRVGSSGPAPGNILKDTLTKDLVAKRVIAGKDGVVYLHSSVNDHHSYCTPAPVTQAATQDNENGPKLYSEDCIRKLLKEKMQNEVAETANESKRMRVESAPSNRTSDVQAASLRGDVQANSLRSDVQAKSLGGGERARSLRGGGRAPNSRSIEQTSKEAVMDPRKVDWEDKIPMDLISFVDEVDQNSSPIPSSLIYLPDYGRQILPISQPFTACITDVRSEREDKQDSDDDLIEVNNAPPVPCIEID